MRHLTVLLPLLALSVFVSGCATTGAVNTPASEPDLPVTVTSAPPQDPWRLSTAHVEGRRSGAAYLQGGVEHVLTRNPGGGHTPPEPVQADLPALSQVLQSDLVEGGVSTRIPTPPAASPDVRERAAWVKFCHGAEDLSDEDWELIRGKQVPDDLVARCTWPK